MHNAHTTFIQDFLDIASKCVLGTMFKYSTHSYVIRSEGDHVYHPLTTSLSEEAFLKASASESLENL